MNRPNATRIVHTLANAGHTAYFAGGCVRDMLMGIIPHDYDVATSATPSEVQSLFPRTEAVGISYGVILVIDEGIPTEVATFRNDGYYADGRRPESVHFTTAQEDARRRDFTINGLFFNPLTGETLDYVDGRADIAGKMLRAIGEPALRFNEDKLRLLRCIRFANRFDFSVDPTTWDALQELAPQITTVSAERIREEMTRILTGPRAGHGLDLLRQSHLLGFILPEALAMVDCPQPPQWHPEGDVWTHTCLMLDSLEDPSPALAWSVLFHDIAKPLCLSFDEQGIPHHYEHEKRGADLAVEILRRLKASNALISSVHDLVLYHMQFKDVRKMKSSTLKRMMARPTYPDELCLHKSDCLSSHRKLDNYEFLLAKEDEYGSAQIAPPPLISGRDLMAIGFAPGPTMGRILDEISDLQLEGKLLTPEEALAFAKAAQGH